MFRANVTEPRVLTLLTVDADDQRKTIVLSYTKYSSIIILTALHVYPARLFSIFVSYTLHSLYILKTNKQIYRKFTRHHDCWRFKHFPVSFFSISRVHGVVVRGKCVNVSAIAFVDASNASQPVYCIIIIIRR